MATYNANANFTTQPNSVGGGGGFSYQLVFSSLDASDGVAKIQYSNDGDNWSDVPDLTETVASTEDQVHFNINIINHNFYRLSWDAGSNTAGTIVVTANK